MWASLTCWRQVRFSGFFQSAKRAPLSSRARASCPGSAGLVPDLAADLVERVGGQLDDVKPAQTDRGVRAVRGDGTRDPLRHVARHQLKLGAAVLAEPRQERLDGRAVTARSGPDQPDAVVVDHHGEVALPAADRDLIHADAPELGEHIPPPAGLVGHALTDPADRAPTRAHQRRDRARRRVHRQPRRLVLKGRGEPRAVARPGHGGDDDAMAPTRHARRLGLNVGEGHAEIQRAPAPATLAPVIARTAPPADPAAAALGRAWTDADHDRVTVEQNVLDHDPRQPEQPRPYPYPAHVAPPPRWIPDLTSRNPRSAAACATPDTPLRRARVRNLTPPHQRSRPALSSTANPLQHAYRLASRHPPPKRCLTVAGQRS